MYIINIFIITLTIIHLSTMYIDSNLFDLLIDIDIILSNIEYQLTKGDFYIVLYILNTLVIIIL